MLKTQDCVSRLLAEHHEELNRTNVRRTSDLDDLDEQFDHYINSFESVLDDMMPGWDSLTSHQDSHQLQLVG